MTRSELEAVAAVLARINAALDRCMALIHRQDPPPPTRAGLIRRTDDHAHQDQPRNRYAIGTKGNPVPGLSQAALGESGPREQLRQRDPQAWGRWSAAASSLRPYPWPMPSVIPTTIHLLARRIKDQWVVACLDFDLAAQDCTFEAAQRRLLDQVESYVQEALSIDGGTHASELLSRRAPIANWALFYVAMVLQGLHAAGGTLRGYQQPFQPQAA